MQAREFERRARQRERGIWRYVVRSGVVFYGLPMFVLMTYVFPHPRVTTAQSAMLWLLAGAAYGVVMWLVQERRFRSAAKRY